MSKYTTEVRYICEVAAERTESAGFDDVQAIVTTAAPKIFNFPFPIYDEEYRLPLETKILTAFYTREIGSETVGLWRLRLAQKLNEIMPYYNQLYKSTTLDFNPLYDVNITRTHKTTNTGDTTVDNTETNNGTDNKTMTQGGTIGDASTNTRWDLYSDTPQGGVNGLNLDMGVAAANGYLTNAEKISDTNNDTQTFNRNDTDNRTVDMETTLKGKSTVNNIEDYIENVVGKQGTQSYNKLIKEYRENMLNIDAMIIHDLEPLFMGLW